MKISFSIPSTAIIPIHFTVEKENDKPPPFLDVLGHKENYQFSTSLFRKSTFTGLFTDLSSLSPSIYKVNLISILVFRAFHICSSYVSFHKE